MCNFLEAVKASGSDYIEAPQLLRGYRAMVIGRRLDHQASNLAKQGYLAVYPSSRGQEACQVGAALALGQSDWLFPTYRDTVAMISHGVDPVEALTMLRGDWHCGFDPRRVRTAPHSTPLATHAAHAVGLAMAARLDGANSVALVLCGDGATSEGGFHEAVNLAAVFDAPVVFLVQNNGYAISVPTAKQLRARSIADKAAGYGVPGVQIDGNNFAGVLKVVREAVARARRGDGPTLIEAHTYRMAPHTSSDNPSLYRDAAEVDGWKKKDPIDRLKKQLESAGALAYDLDQAIGHEAEEAAARMRSGVIAVQPAEAHGLFSHVYAVPPPHLLAQAKAQLDREMWA